MRLKIMSALLMFVCSWAVPPWAAAEDLAKVRQSLQSQQLDVRLAAVATLAREKENVPEAVTILSGLLHDSAAEVRARAAEALGHHGPAAASARSALVEKLADPETTVRRAAAKALGRLGADPEVTLPLLVKLLEDKDPSVRNRAMDSLAESGAQGLDRLIASLGNEKTAYWACLIVNEIGPKAAAAVPALVKLLDDPQIDVRREAILALGSIGAAASSAVPQLSKILDDPQQATAATYALGRIGKAPSPEAEAKIEQATTGSDAVRQTVSLWALARFHLQNKDLVAKAASRLVERLNSDDARVREAAIHGLIDLAPGEEVMAPLMAKFLDQADPDKALAALRTVAKVGRLDPRRLMKALKHEKLQSRVAFLLGEMGAKAEPAVPALADLLQARDADTCREAAIALAKIGPAAKAAVPALSDLVGKQEAPARYAACYALGRIGPDASAAKPALLALLSGTDETIGLIGAWALAQIDPKAADVAAKSVPVLVRGLSDQDVRFRHQAASALSKLGPLAKEALPALEKATHDENEAVRAAAQEAIRAIRP